MELRKQKRLGAAPIASFEKSFEDSPTAANTTTISTATVAMAANVGDSCSSNGVLSSTIATDFSLTSAAKDINRNRQKMESHDSRTKAATTTITTTVTTTTNTQQHPLQQHPSISVAVTESLNTSSTTTTNSSSSGCNNKLANDGNSKRAPPLKAATAATTLLSSGSGSASGSVDQQQLQLFRGITTLTTPSTPRIELSRASSSSQHEEDSRDSSPENVFEQVGTGTLQETIGLGFREEGALELRSSTEELYFMDPEQKKEEQEKMQQQQAKRSSPHIFKFEDHQSYLQQHQRKDSASSEVAALLCISGRTSRISSVGSQGSAVSRLSAISGVSRSPSPHRMLLETSFCGPKPLENVVDGRVSTTIEPPTAELLEQVLLSRKHDPTQVVLAEGIKVQSSPKKKPTSLSNGDASGASAVKSAPAAGRVSTGATAKTLSAGTERRSSRSPGQMVVGKTPSGTEYIRINLKPDYMYEDKGIAPHERLVEAPDSLAPVYSRPQKKPASLSLGRSAVDPNRLTPTASPKPVRHSILSKESHGSRSPSPATVSVSRKSSFSSLFRLGGKDSPDSPRERSRSRSKSKERQTSQSLSATPSKQRSVLAIFKPGKRGSNAGNDQKSSKSSSPIDPHEPTHQQIRGKSQTPIMTATGSRPASRLRYYDEPVEGYIHIPLHTPPEEKEARKLLQGIQQLNAEPMRPVGAPITASQLAAAAKALKPVAARKDSGNGQMKNGQSRPPPVEKQVVENLDAIHSLPHDEDNNENKECTRSTEVHRHSSQDSQETAGSEASFASAIKVNLRSNLAHVKEHVVQENGTAAEAEIHRLPSVESTMSTCEAKIVETVATVNVSITQQQESELAKEKRRLLFATRLGSGSQEQIFSTQFSISKTESQSSQLSEQMQETIAESPGSDYLHRQGTVIRRSEEDTDSGVPASATTAPTPEAPTVPPKPPPKRHSSNESGRHRPKSVSTSEDEKPAVKTTVAAVIMRRKESHEETRRKSRSTSEDDVDVVVNQRHSRYLENFDVRKKYHENVPRKPKRQSISETKRSDTSEESTVPPIAVVVQHEAPPPPPKPQQQQQQQQLQQQQQQQRKPTLPQPPPPSTAPSPSPPATVSTAGSRTPTPTKPTPRSQSQSPVERSRQTPTKPPRTSTPPRRPHPTTDRQSVLSTDEPVESSESERDSDLAVGGGGGGSSASIDPKRRHLPRHVGVIEDHESTGLVSQESFDELPYVPTTLPEERAQGVSLIPMKERANMELKTCPVDRPRSTTPLNPSHLEEYMAAPQEPSVELSGTALVRGEKLRISLPRKDSQREKVQSAKSPRRTSNASGKSWFEFAEEGLRATNLERKDSNKQLLQQQQKPEETGKTKTAGKALTTTVQTTQVTPTSGAGTSTQRKLSGHWIDFENIPEKRKPPKRITTLPKEAVTTGTASGGSVRGQHGGSGTHGHHTHHHHAQPDVTASTGNGSSDGKLHYNYVKPEDCQCECHEVQREAASGVAGGATAATAAAGTTATTTAEAGSKALTAGVDLLQQGEDMLPLLDPETQDGIEPSDSSREYSCYTDDEMDVPMRHSGSSRSKSSSSKLDEFPRRDVSHSPRNRKFPDNRK